MSSVTSTGTLRGQINRIESLTGHIRSEGQLHAGISNEIPEYAYEGEYEVIPKVVEQKLQTNARLLLDDVTVRKIPKESVSNEAGGYTVTIGGY